MQLLSMPSQISVAAGLIALLLSLQSPLIAVNSTHLFTPPVGVAHFRNAEAGTDYGPLMAAATIIIAPLIIAFLLAQRRFIEGITFTGMK